MSSRPPTELFSGRAGPPGPPRSTLKSPSRNGAPSGRALPRNATRTALLIALASAALLVCWFIHPTPGAPALARPSSPTATAPSIAPASAPTRATAPADTGAHPATIEAVKNFYRREQIKFELALEQRRYGAHYWSTELGTKHLHELHAERLARLAELNSELHGVLRELSAHEADLAFELAPLFDPERAGPNVTFLASASREKIEILIAELSRQGPLNAVALLARARDLLSDHEFSNYTQWNAPAAALRRTQLVGFDANEAEFNLLAQWPDFVNAASHDSTHAESAAHAVKRQLGAERFAALMNLRTPEMQTAVHDLHRLGLPLDHAEWLRDFRAQSVQTMQTIWQDSAASAVEKTARVNRLQHDYRTSLLATLSPAGAAFDETELLP